MTNENDQTSNSQQEPIEPTAAATLVAKVEALVNAEREKPQPTENYGVHVPSRFQFCQGFYYYNPKASQPQEKGLQIGVVAGAFNRIVKNAETKEEQVQTYLISENGQAFLENCCYARASEVLDLILSQLNQLNQTK